MSEKELFDAKLSGLQALIQANFDIVHRELKHINSNASKLSERIERIEGKYDPCPSGVKLQKRVADLEKWKWRSVGYVTGAGAIVALLFRYVL